MVEVEVNKEINENVEDLKMDNLEVPSVNIIGSESDLSEEEDGG